MPIIFITCIVLDFFELNLKQHLQNNILIYFLLFQHKFLLFSTKFMKKFGKFGFFYWVFLLGFSMGFSKWVLPRKTQKNPGFGFFWCQPWPSIDINISILSHNRHSIHSPVLSHTQNWTQVATANWPSFRANCVRLFVCEDEERL